jgi:hypothetical protein
LAVKTTLFTSKVRSCFSSPKKRISAQRRDRNESGFLRQGTNERGRFPDNLDSGYGDRFEAILDQDSVSNGWVLARVGSVVSFRLVDVTAGQALNPQPFPWIEMKN